MKAHIEHVRRLCDELLAARILLDCIIEWWGYEQDGFRFQ